MIFRKSLDNASLTPWELRKKEGGLGRKRPRLKSTSKELSDRPMEKAPKLKLPFKR